MNANGYPSYTITVTDSNGDESDSIVIHANNSAEVSNIVRYALDNSDDYSECFSCGEYHPVISTVEGRHGRAFCPKCAKKVSKM